MSTSIETIDAAATSFQDELFQPTHDKDTFVDSRIEEFQCSHSSFVGRTMNAAHSVFNRLVSKIDNMPTPSKIGLGALAAGALLVGGKEVVAPTGAEARTSGPIRDPAFYIANTEAESQATLSDLKKVWQKNCRKKDNKNNFYLVRIGQEQRGLTSEEESSPPAPAYTIASMSCKTRRNVRVSVNGGGEDPGHVYDSWTRNYKKSKLYTSQVNVPVNLSTRLEANTKAGLMLALRAA